MLLLLSDERFLPGQAVEGKCQLSVPSYKASMVVGQTQKPLHIFSRAGSRPVLDGLYKSALNSNLLWNKAHFFGLNFRTNSRNRANTLRRLARWSSKSLPRTKGQHNISGEALQHQVHGPEKSGRGIRQSEPHPNKFVQSIPDDKGWFPLVLT